MKKPKAKKSKMGRPITVGATRMLGYRVDAATVLYIEELAARWQCSKAEVVRRAVGDAQEKSDRYQ